MRPSALKSRFLQSAAILVVATASSIGGAAAQTVITSSNANVLNLLSPFLGLNGSAVGKETLSDNLSQSIVVNNGSFFVPGQQALAISDKNLLGSASNAVTLADGTKKLYGVAANLAGGLPAQASVNGITPVQSIGGLGSTLGAIYQTGVNPNSTALTSTVNLLTQAYNFTSGDLGVAKFYFANGAVNGTSTAVAPTGYSLPTSNLNGVGVLPNTKNSVYDIAYGVKNTDPGQNIYGSSRPAQVSSQIKMFDPTALNGLTTNPAFPSGHTTYAYTDSILIGMLVPQLYQSMVVRASEYGNSRIALGVHYPLDIIAGRSLASYDLAQALNNPNYTSANIQSLFTSAKAELTPYLQAQCGGSIASCAASQTNPYAPSAANAAVYSSRLTYNLPTLTYAQAPQEQAPSGSPDASILLATLYGGDSAAAKVIAPTGGIAGKLATSTIKQILVNTEGEALSAFYGSSLSYWSRLNLYGAAGYFGGVTGTLKTANGDEVKTDVTVAPGGVIDVTGLFTVDGKFDLEAGSALGFFINGLTPATDYGQLQVGQTADLDGVIGVRFDRDFQFKDGYSFDLVNATGGLTNGVSGLTFDGLACSGLGGGSYQCGRSVFLSVFGQGNGLTLKVDAVPEPSTWAMLIAGFAGLGFAGWRRRATSRALV